MAADTSTITYQCPSCSATIEVSQEFVDEMVDCPKCSIPFHAEAPSAEPILTESGEAPKADYQVTQPSDDEAELVVAHPAMLRRHPLQFLGMSLVLVGSAALGVWAAAVGHWWVTYVSGFALVAAIGFFAYWWLLVVSTTLIVTNKRTTLRKGIIAKRTTEVQHDDIRNMQVHQNVWQRIMGVGDLAISSSGQDDLEVQMKALPKPDEVADLVRSMQ